MNSSVFKEWLLNLDKEMRAAQRNILLLVDNVSSHSLGDIVMTNVVVQKLPPNTTTYLQPLDAGIIASFKARYRTRQIDEAIDRFDAGEDVEGRSVYKIDQLQAMKLSQEIWESTTAASIAHCWQKTGLALPVRGWEAHDADDISSAAEAVTDKEELVDLLLKVSSISL